MTDEIFGRSITRGYAAYWNNTEVVTASTAPALYLFSSEPTREAARDGTGAIQTKTSWNRATAAPYLNTYSFDPVDDPSPTSTTTAATYWEAINYRLELSQQVQTELRSFDIERAVGGQDSVGTTVLDLQEIYPAITNYLTGQQLTDILDAALEQMKIDLEAVSLEWSLIRTQSKLKLTLAYLCIAMSSESQIVQEGDKFTIRAALYRSLYESNKNKITLIYGTEETPQKAGMSFMIANR